MAKWLNDLFKEYIEEELEEDLSSFIFNSPDHVKVGGVYFGSLKALNTEKTDKPIYFVVIRKIDDNLYEVMKASDWHHFASNTDAVFNVLGMNLMVETTSNFYLKEEEIRKFRLLDVLDKSIISEILNFRQGKSTERIKTGYTPLSKVINLGDEYEDIREKFKKNEFEQIKENHLRIFEFLSEPEETDLL